MSTLAIAEALCDQAEKALAAGVVVTLDGDTANARCGQGQPIVLFQPPVQTFETYTLTATTWTVLLIASYPTTVPAWAELDDMVQALREPLDVDEARPASFQPPQGPPWPALQLTITHDNLDA